MHLGGAKRIELILVGPQPTVHTNTLQTSYLINIWNTIRTSNSHRLGYYIEASLSLLALFHFQSRLLVRCFKHLIMFKILIRLEQVEGIEPSSQPWQGRIITFILYLHKLVGTSGLEPET